MGLLQGERLRHVPARETRTYAGQAAEDLRVLLRRNGITNRELALACDRTEWWVGKRINGQIPIDLDDLEVFARALGVTPAELLPKTWKPPVADDDAGWPREEAREPTAPYLTVVGGVGEHTHSYVAPLSGLRRTA